MDILDGKESFKGAGSYNTIKTLIVNLGIYSVLAFAVEAACKAFVFEPTVDVEIGRTCEALDHRLNTNRWRWGRRGWGLEPFEIKGVMVTTANQMYEAVGTLTYGQVAAIFGAVGAECDCSAVGTFDGSAGPVVGDQSLIRPGFAFIFGYGGEEPANLPTVPCGVRNLYTLGDGSK